MNLFTKLKYNFRKRKLKKLSGLRTKQDYQWARQKDKSATKFYKKRHGF